MMRWIVGSGLQFRLLVVVIAAVLLFFGFMQLREMPVDVLPEFSRPYVEIQTEALGLSAEEVEAMITTPLEADMLNGAAWVDEIRSESIPGLSSIKLFFEPGTDILDARQMVQERLIEVYALPAVSKPPVMLQPVSSANRCMSVGLTSDELSLIQLSVLARWTIKPRLMGVPGVANVSIWGQRERQLQVRVDPKELHEKGVKLDQIISTTGNSLWASPLTFLDAAVPGTGGFIDTPNQRLTIMHKSPITTADELAKVVVEGTDTRLEDVAQVVEDHQLLIGDAIVGDAPALMLVVEKFPWSNTVDVTRGVEEALVALRPAVKGVEMDASLFRPATFIETAMANMTTTLLIAGALVAVALLVLLNNWRSGLIGIVAILLSVVTAGLVIYLLGAKVNMLIIAGVLVALAAIIDDAVVDIQNIARRLRQHHKRGSEESVAWVIREATIEMRGVLLYATLIVLLAVAPIFFMKGIAGAFLQPAAYAYAVAVIASLLVGLTVTPVLAVLLLRGATPVATESPIGGALARAYEGIVTPILSRPRVAFAVVAVLVVAAAGILPNVRQESLYPKFKETAVVVGIDATPGTSHPAMSQLVTSMTRELRKIGGVKNVSAHIGRAITSDEAADVDSSEIWVSIDPAADYDATMSDLRDLVHEYSGRDGLDCDLETYLNDRIHEQVQGEDRGLVVRVYGDDLAKVEELAEDVVVKLKTVDGLKNAIVEAPERQPRIEIEPDLEKCKAHGIKPGEVRRTAAVLLSALEVGNLFEEQKVFEVVVWGKPEIRENLDSVRNLLIETPTGEPVRLEELAHVRLNTGPMVINREAVARYIDVTADFYGRDLGAIGSDVQKALSQIHFPLEYRAEMLGAPAERLAAQRRVFAYAIAAAIGIYLLLQVACSSWRLALLVMFMLPLSMVGGLVAILVTGGIISFGSILGFIAVLAIAARNCVLLVRRYQNLAVSAGVDPEVADFRAHFDRQSPLNDTGQFDSISPELVRSGTCDRFVPILASTVAIFAAVAPFVVLGSIPGLEVLHPMAIVILGGLVTTAVVSLYLLPALYLWLKVEPAPAIVTEPIRVEEEVKPATA